MKKIIALLLVLVMSLSIFAACGEETPAGPTLEEAVAMLEDYYRADDGKPTPANYKVAAKLPIGDVEFELTWECSLDSIQIVLEDGLYTVKVPSKNDTEVEYTLTATIKDAKGNTEKKVYKRILPVYDNSAAVTEPVENEAYKLYFVQAKVGKTLFCIGEAQNDKFIKTTVNPKDAADFFVEKVDGGYKFYTTIGGTKMYLHAHTTTDDAGKISKYLSFEAESDAVYYYKEEVKTWMVTIDNFEYGVGTYGTFETMSLSEGTYFTAESAGTSQFCMALMGKAAAEALTPTEGPADPTELTSIPAFLEIAGALADKDSTAEKYLVKGTIVEIKSTTYGNMYIEDDEGNQLYVYGVYSKDGANRYDVMNPQPQVGDTVILMGVAKNYGGAQMENGWVQELIPGEGGGQPEDPTPDVKDPAADTQLSIKDAIALGESKEHNTYTEGKYYVTGQITEIYNETYGNMKLTDSEGNILTIYGTYDADGTNRFDAMATKPAVGDTVIIYGIVGQYNGTAQIKNGWIVPEIPSGGNTENPTPGTLVPTVVTEFQVGTAYKLGYFSEGTNAWHYTINAMDGYYVDITDDVNAAGAVYVEAVEGQENTYRLYILDGETKVYIEAEKSGTHNNIKLNTTSNGTTYTWDATYSTFVTELEGLKLFLGSRSNYTTLSLNDYDKYVTSNYVAHLIVMAEGTEKPEDPTPSAEYVTAPVIGTAYKMGLIQTAKGETYFFTGAMKGYYGNTVTAKADGIDVYLEDAGNGAYYITFTVDGAKKYVGTQVSGTHLNFIIVDEAERASFTWNADYSTLMTVMSDGTETFMGTSGNYYTIGMMAADKLADSYPVHLFNV